MNIIVVIVILIICLILGLESVVFNFVVLSERVKNYMNEVRMVLMVNEICLLFWNWFLIDFKIIMVFK